MIYDYFNEKSKKKEITLLSTYVHANNTRSNEINIYILLYLIFILNSDDLTR